METFNHLCNLGRKSKLVIILFVAMPQAKSVQLNLFQTPFLKLSHVALTFKLSEQKDFKSVFIILKCPKKSAERWLIAELSPNPLGWWGGSTASHRTISPPHSEREQYWWEAVEWGNFPPPELDQMDIDLLTRMEGLVGGVLISPSKSKVTCQIHWLKSQWLFLNTRGFILID